MACDQASDLVVPVAALVAAAEVVDAQHVVADDVPHVDGRHLRQGEQHRAETQGRQAAGREGVRKVLG